MAGDESPEALLARWRHGDQEAATQLYIRFARRLWFLASRHLGERWRRRVDPDDILQSAFRTFFRRTREGQYEVSDAAAVAYLLVRITLHKVAKAVEREGMQKRDPGRETYDEEARLASRAPTPEEEAALADEVQCLSQRFPERDRQILAMHFEGGSNRAIASRMGISEATVRRVLERFRQLVEERLGQEEG